MRFDEEELTGEDDETEGVPAPRAFKRDEMVACESCGRANPPTRMKCLYCGEPLPAAEAGRDSRQPILKPLEEWERGYNVVLAPRRIDDVHVRGDALAEAAQLLRIKPGQLDEMIASRAVLPLARTGVRDEVALMEARLGELGLGVEIVSDEELGVESQPPRRVRKLEFDGESITGWQRAGEESHHVDWGDVLLVVTGRIFKKRIEVEERAKRGAAGEVVDSRELLEDEAVVDLHFANVTANWRVKAEGFDYSCLGARKSLLSAENFAPLVEALRERAPHGAFDDSYNNVRQWLQFAWAPTEHTESGGVRRAGAGRYNTEAVTTVTNETQFTRYGRLLRHYAARGGREQS